MYSTGEGVPQDDGEAVKWFRLAADQGNASAQFSLGNMYRTGEGVPQDYGEAVKWFRLAADQGDVWAQLRLGVMYQMGQGVPQDDAEAFKWYRLAADQGDVWAQFGASLISVGEMTLRLYGALSYSENSARDLRCAINGA